MPWRPTSSSRPAIPDWKSEALEGIATWALQFTPDLSPAPPEAVLLEIGGCLKLFGGLARLLERVRDGLLDLGLEAHAGRSPHPDGGPYPGPGRPGTAGGGSGRSPPPLGCPAPGSAWTSPAQTLDALAQLGLKTLGDCLALPRAGLARRFGTGLLDELDRALGHKPDPRPLFALPEGFAASLELAAPVAEVEALLFGVKRLVTQLCGWLAARNAGVRRLTLSLAHERQPATAIVLALTAPQRDASHLLALLRERLARQDLAAGVAGLALRAEETAQLVPQNFSLFGDRERIRADCLNLVERLQARLGPEAVNGLALCPEHRPELAWRETEPGQGAAQRRLPACGRSGCWRGPVPWPAMAPAPGWPGPWPSWPGRNASSRAGGMAHRYAATITRPGRPAGPDCWVYLELGSRPRWFLHGLFA